MLNGGEVVRPTVDVREVVERFAKQSPGEILAWTFATYPQRAILACSFGGPSGMVLLDLALQIQPDLPVFYLDTGLLFPETYALVDLVKRRYGIEPLAVHPSLSVDQQAAQLGAELWARDPDRCCDLRKVQPQRQLLQNYDAWITGLRRYQSTTRRQIAVIQWDDIFGLVKVNPLASWTEAQVWDYIDTRQIPYNRLHEQRYPSIGCMPCTRSVADGEDPRAGRWSGFTKTECGLHQRPATLNRKATSPVTANDDTPHPDLATLGPGADSKVEHIKAESHLLRGTIAAQLAEPTNRFTEDQTQLLKFHGTYQQDDRDIRRMLGAEKAYQFMVRSRIPGGVLTADQYLAEDEIAGKYANGTLRITTRQGFQLHGVLKGDLKATIAAINVTLLSTLAACGDVNRNVMACVAPLPDRAQAELVSFADQLAQRLAPRSGAYHEIWLDGEQVETIELPASNGTPEVELLYGPTYLPRKFKIGIAYPGDNCVDIYSQDIGLVAELANEQLAGFTVLIGGGMGMTHGKAETFPRLATPFCFVPIAQATTVVEAILMVQRDYGDRINRKHARMKYLVEERGIPWFRAEVEQRIGFALAEPHPLVWADADDHLGWHQQANGDWFLGIFVENGRIHDTPSLRLRSGLRAVIERYRPGVRLTPQQNLLLTDIPTRRKGLVAATLARYGLTTNPNDLGVIRHSLACPALPTCGLALAEAERVLPELIRAMQRELQALGIDAEPLSVRMTGCPNGCARPYLGNIGIVGRSKDLYTLFIGGDRAGTRLNQLYAEGVTTSTIVSTLRPLLVIWQANRQPGEAFGDYAERIGLNALRQQAIALTPSVAE